MIFFDLLPPRLRRCRPVALAALSGVGVALAAPGVLSVAPPWAMAWLAWIALVPLLVGISESSPPKAAFLGWVASMMLQVIAMSWFPGLMARFAGLPPGLAIGLGLTIFALQALGWAIWAASLRYLFPRWPLSVAAPLTFMAMEYAMPLLFPFSLGLTQYCNLPLAQVAEAGGIHVVSALLVAFNAAVAHGIVSKTRRWQTAILALSMMVLIHGGGWGRMVQIRNRRQSAAPMRMGWVQAGGIAKGWQAGAEQINLTDYQHLSHILENDVGPLDLVIWPEKAVGLLLRTARHDYGLSHPLRIRKGFTSPLLFGVTSVDKASREIRNAAAFLQPDDQLGVVYEKIRLIPYSEWLPSFLESRENRRYRPGESMEPVQVGGISVGVFICFESTFPSHVRTIGRRSSVLVNLSDDTWFGDTAEPEQHLAHAVFRAIENRRDLLRVSGGGISALIGATGEILSLSSLNRSHDDFKTGWGLVRRLEEPSWYGTIGDAVPVVSLLVSTMGLGLRLRERRRGRPSPS
ncbi:MAG TPA: apolipoprotein N-acyltransferase [Polyangiaceae bacterium]|nr:apolipoprotein N-acyltransferase [Polyangiaceae bacterium]